MGWPRVLVVCCSLGGCAQLIGIHDDQGDASIDAPTRIGDGDSGSTCMAALSENGSCPNDLAAGVATTCVLSNGLWCWGHLAPGAADEMQPFLYAAANPSLVALANTPDPDSTTNGVGCYLQDGSAMCWGPDDYGELGGAPTSLILSPQAENSSGNLVHLAVGGDHVCAAPISPGDVECTGEDDNDQIGSGSADSSCNGHACDTRPETVAIAVEGVIAAGGSHTCVSPGGMYSIACWGNNSSGQLGNPGAGAASPPVPVMKAGGGMLEQASVLALGTTHSCAIVGMETYCWGDNSSGQLGIGSGALAQEGSAMLVDPSPAANFVKIAAGGETTCAIDNTGGVWCWGSDRQGTAGQPADPLGAFPQIVASPAPVMLGSGMPVATEIAVGFNHACAVVTTGDIYCWGDNESYELGDGSIDHGESACGAQDCSHTPVLVTR